MSTEFLLRRLRGEKKRREDFSLKVALSYIGFLLLCLALGVALYASTTQNAQESYWEHRASELELAISRTDDDLAAMDSYTRQLLIDNTFVRFAGMEGIHQKGFLYTAYEVMQTLTSRIYSISDLPVMEDRIYLKKSGYVISASQFTEVRQFYEDYRIYHPGGFEQWFELVNLASGEGSCLDISAFTGHTHDYVFIRDIDAIMNKSVPAVIWFELDMNKLRKRFLPQDAYADAMVTVWDENGRQLLLAADETRDAFADEMQAAAFDERGMAELDGMRLIRRQSARKDWQYVIALPLSLCDEALGNYDLLFWIIMLIALLSGGAVVAWLVRYNMRPIQQLNTRLRQAEGDRALLQQEMDQQRPMLAASCLRKLLSGHVTSNDEFDYLFRVLGLQTGWQFYALYCVAHRQDSALPDPLSEDEIILSCMEKHLGGDHPLCHYVTLDRSYVVLTAYPPDAPDPLMDLQRRVLNLHNDLTDNHSLWFYAGVGERCTQPQNLWESYEQARRAARYTGRHHIFLPYEVIRKDADSFYYPVEYSSKLQNFITTGNQQQVVEMFSLIRRENLEERSLPVALLSFLFSDLKNTLLKARFQAVPQTDEQRDALARVDECLYGQPTFEMLEATAVLLCECFVRASDPSDPIADVEKYLEENFTDPSMCLSKLSDQFHISESYLSHLFKNKTGQNFSVYLENLRLSEAQRRLKDASCNLSLLYAELGYNNPTTFRRAFKKRFGVPPSEMRG